MHTDLATMMMRHSVGAISNDLDTCSRCERTPLAGELMHELEDHRHVCQLCLARMPESKREPVRTDRVHTTGARRLAVMPRAA